MDTMDDLAKSTQSLCEKLEEVHRSIQQFNSAIPLIPRDLFPFLDYLDLEDYGKDHDLPLEIKKSLYEVWRLRPINLGASYDFLLSADRISSIVNSTTTDIEKYFYEDVRTVRKLAEEETGYTCGLPKRKKKNASPTTPSTPSPPDDPVPITTSYAEDLEALNDALRETDPSIPLISWDLLPYFREDHVQMYINMYRLSTIPAATLRKVWSQHPLRIHLVLSHEHEQVHQSMRKLVYQRWKFAGLADINQTVEQVLQRLFPHLPDQVKHWRERLHLRPPGANLLTPIVDHHYHVGMTSTSLKSFVPDRQCEYDPPSPSTEQDFTLWYEQVCAGHEQPPLKITWDELSTQREHFFNYFQSYCANAPPTLSLIQRVQLRKLWVNHPLRVQPVEVYKAQAADSLVTNALQPRLTEMSNEIEAITAIARRAYRRLYGRAWNPYPRW